MREVKLHQLVSFSSEDTVHQASNLLKSSGQQKWLCAGGGEKEASVLFQLETACEISSVDIGNAGSAFVEVLVGRSSGSDFQVLVVASSFMTPGDSKVWKNIHSVRLFNKDSMNKATAEQKWDRVKVVCRQPFNKVEKFGLSFVKLRGPGDPGTASSSAGAPVPSMTSTPSFGKFNLRDTPGTASQMAVGSLFADRLDPASSSSAATQATAASSSMAAQARDASSSLTTKTTSSAAKTTSSNLTPSPEPAAKASAASRTSPTPHASKRKASPGIAAVRDDSGSDGSKHAPAAKRTMRRTGGKTSVPLDQSLAGVVFALSGFQNPLRGNLRDKGLGLGAQYRSQWETGCTHLIAAFPNTPKYNQVKRQHGIIVQKDWIEQCHSAGRRLSTKQFVFNTADGSDTSSDEDNDTRSTQPYRNAPPQSTQAAASNAKNTAGRTGKASPSLSASPSASPRSSPQAPSRAQRKRNAQASAAIDYSDSDDGRAAAAAGGGGSVGIRDRDATAYDSGSNTEDELEKFRLLHQKKAAATVGVAVIAEPSSGSDTEVDDEMVAIPAGQKMVSPKPKPAEPTAVVTNAVVTDAAKSPSAAKNAVAANVPPPGSGRGRPPRLASFFAGLHFLLFGDFTRTIRKSLTRYIAAYGGVIEEYMADSVAFVVTDSEWDGNFDQALADVKTLKFVRPSWVMQCHDEQLRLPLLAHEVKKATE